MITVELLLIGVLLIVVVVQARDIHKLRRKVTDNQYMIDSLEAKIEELSLELGVDIYE